MRKQGLVLTITIFFAFNLIGCDQQKDSKESKLALMKTTQPAPIDIDTKTNKESLSEEVKQTVLNNQTIYDVAVIEGKKQILVAYKVRHFYRFKMKKVEKDLKEQLEAKFSGKKFIVSSDYKIFLESVRLKEAVKDQTISNEEANKRFKEIIKLTEELT